MTRAVWANTAGLVATGQVYW